MQEPRSAGAMGAEFPYTLQTMCYIEVATDGSVRWGTDTGAYSRALAGESRLFAAWPGQWSTHLFAIDDLDQYARAFGIIHDEARTGLADHQHQASWTIHPTEDKPNGTYITINVRLACGCEIHDLKTFASQMRQQKGWDIATTGGWGGSSGTHYMRARRKSLT
ncbi:hypothetical protein [Amycolatopsis sp. NPDC049868]|uniref:hypothetical protein n=1 Tax=Amycolatopsis sp. NPDC049868 TaxID=3363934 RepID=UPI00378CCCE3